MPIIEGTEEGFETEINAYNRRGNYSSRMTAGATAAILMAWSPASTTQGPCQSCRG